MIHRTGQSHKGTDQTRPRGPILGAGLLLLCMELWKQAFLYLEVFGGHYNVWYLPFQLCSMPMYMAIGWAVAIKRKRTGTAAVLATFMQDFGVLGGIAALIVHDGFTWPEHPMLTAHGYIWHVLLIALGIYLWRTGRSDLSLRGFLRSVGLFMCCAIVAELINVALHGYGDCDMFYISPYHLSSQPVFREVDRVLGRPAGIGVYLLCVVLGAGLVHLCFSFNTVRQRFNVLK